MNDLAERIAATIADRRLLLRGDSVFVAVSGGLDSMALLHLLGRLAPDYGWRITVAHFNHQLRGRSSDADERLFRRAAAKLKLPIAVGRADVRSFARHEKLSIEMAARKLRHQFLAHTAARRGIHTIALAHHADDQVELFFVRLLRGSGGDGLAGMKWQSPSPANPKIKLIRPLLAETKGSLHAWAKSQKIPYREDATNAQLDILRNRIRHELLPLLTKHYQPALSKVILRQMEILGADAASVESSARSWLKQSAAGSFDDLTLAVQRRVLQLQLAKLRIPASFDLIELLRQQAGRPVTVAPDTAILRDATGRMRQIHSPKPLSPKSGAVRLQLKGRAGEAVFDGARLTWTIKAGRGLVPTPKKQLNCEQFDADKVGAIIRLRHWLPGDRFQPIGMGTAVKLQDLFTNKKILRGERTRLIVATTAGGEPFWVEGLRIAERFKLDKRSRRRLIWRWKRL